MYIRLPHVSSSYVLRGVSYKVYRSEKQEGKSYVVISHLKNWKCGMKLWLETCQTFSKKVD